MPEAPTTPEGTAAVAEAILAAGRKRRGEKEEVSMSGLRIYTTPQSTGAIQPTESEAERLLEIITRRFPWVDEHPFDVATFRLAFLAQSRFYRAPATDRSRYFHAWVERASDLLDRPVYGPAFLAAVIASGEVIYQLKDNAGHLIELGLNEFKGRSCSNRWKLILAGQASLLEPVSRGRPAGAPPFAVRHG
jgi:hypothetical protein